MPPASYIVFNYAHSHWDVDSAPVGQIDLSHVLTIWVQQYWWEYPFSAYLEQYWPKDTFSTFLRAPIARHNVDLPIVEDIAHTLHHIERLKRAGKQITLTFSRSGMQELDAIFSETSIREQFEILVQIVEVVREWRHCYAIGIDFSEVFLAEEGQALPVHYRPDVDRVVTTLAEYQHHSAQFSYQFAKVFLGIVSEGFTPINPMASYIYSGWWQTHTPNRLAFNDLTHILEVKAFLKRRTYEQQIVLRLGPQINFSDLQYCHTEFLNCTKLREVIFLLSGSHYPKKRSCTDLSSMEIDRCTPHALTAKIILSGLWN